MVFSEPGKLLENSELSHISV